MLRIHTHYQSWKYERVVRSKLGSIKKEPEKNFLYKDSIVKYMYLQSIRSEQ